jgi:hypothetical protein
VVNWAKDLHRDEAHWYASQWAAGALLKDRYQRAVHGHALIEKLRNFRTPAQVSPTLASAQSG